MKKALFVLFMSAALPALGHEVRPAYLEISETAGHGYQVLWKQPVMGVVAVHLVPHLSAGWLEQPPSAVDATASFVIETWRIPPREPPLDGQTASIEGLENTITDTLVVVRNADRTAWQTILTPAHPAQMLHLGSQAHAGMPLFLRLGIEHILTGIDHLLFLLGLLLIVPNRWMLVKTVTAFTVAHSVTLAIATLGYAHAPVPFISAAIALSIVFLGPEIVRRQRGGTSLTLRHPWVVAFLFGLLHGFGFASGLTGVGLTPQDVPLALFLFNVGVEIGQLIFLGLILWLAHAFRVLEIRRTRPLQLLPAYSLGTLGALWTIQRTLILFGAGA